MLKALFVALMTAALTAGGTPAAGAPSIEYVEGVCKEADGSGVVLYSSAGVVDPDFDYISYSGTAAAPGETVRTVLIYAGEDVAARLDMTEAGAVSIE